MKICTKLEASWPSDNHNCSATGGYSVPIPPFSDGFAPNIQSWHRSWTSLDFAGDLTSADSPIPNVCDSGERSQKSSIEHAFDGRSMLSMLDF